MSIGTWIPLQVRLQLSRPVVRDDSPVGLARRCQLIFLAALKLSKDLSLQHLFGLSRRVGDHSALPSCFGPGPVSLTTVSSEVS